MMKKIGIGFVGCGASQSMYGPALRYLDEGQAVAWVDVELQKAQDASTRYGGKAFTDYDEFLKCPGLDAVVIVSPPWLHLTQADAAAKAGKHVLCEKPMGRTVDECRQMIEAVEGRGKILMIGFMKRFSPWFLKIKTMIDSGELGEVFHVSVDWSWPQYALSGWRDKRENLGGLFFDHGSHTIDLCRWWLGEIETAYADVRILLEGREVEDFTQAIYKHQSGAISTHYNSRMTHRPLREAYLIEGSKATVTIECVGKWSFISPEPFVIRKYVQNQEQPIAIDIPWSWDLDEYVKSTWMYLGSLRHFCEAIISEKQPALCTGNDGLKSVEAINAAYISAWKKQVITLPLNETYEPEKIFESFAVESPKIPISR